MSARTAREEFLAAVCPTDTALHILGNVSIAAGGWGSVRPADARPYAKSAIRQARRTVQALDGSQGWPPEVAAAIPAVADDYLDLVAPLGQIVQAPDGAGMAGPWRRIEGRRQAHEQRARLLLGLGLAGTKKDGCPPAPKVSRPAATGGASAGSGGGGSATDSPFRERLCRNSAQDLPLVYPGSPPASGNVQLAQWALMELGYYHAAIGGNYGPQTGQAIRDFQASHGLDADGEVTYAVWARLQAALC